MCGITGYLTAGAPAERGVVERMTATLLHRGPDHDGVLLDGPLGLGHTRLSIIDLSEAADQPMTTADGRYTIVYNGEVYNFRELRRELEALGYSFVSRSDTEVVLQAWAEWGMSALSRFNGMFAFAIWDRAENSLWLARDRYGIKPVYWSQQRGLFVFGSESKAILSHPGIDAELDHAGLLEYLSFQNFFTERTLFRNVSLLPAGCCLEVRPGEAATVTRYWDWDFREPDHAASEADYVEELKRLFAQAVKRQLVSDVPVGAFLSGGMDSGSITAVAAQHLPQMCSFTVGFDLRSASGLELAFDEREAAEHMSYLFGTEHYEMVLKAGDMQRALPRMAPHVEEPRVGQSYPNFYANQLAAKFGKVALAGAGGDEIFGGYPWRYYRAVVNDSFDHYADKYYGYWQRLLSNAEFDALAAPARSRVGDFSARDVFRSVFTNDLDGPKSPEDYVNCSLYFEAKTFLHGLLVIEDKLAMAHGLEVRVPFLDNDLVDFAMRVPVSLKLGNLQEVVRLNENEPGSKTEKYFQRTRDGKRLLRKAMSHFVPEEICNGQKLGFSGPDESWFRGESIDYVRDTLLHGNAWIWSVLDRESGRALIQEHLDGRANRRLLIWSLLSLEEWSRVFLAPANEMRPAMPARVA